MNASEPPIAPAHKTLSSQPAGDGRVYYKAHKSLDWSVCLCYHRFIACDKNIVLKAVKVRIYPTQEQQSHLAGAFGCVRWVWNQSLATMSQTYKETGKGVSALTMKKQIPA